ncbi:MAG: hypothetical protein NWR51_04605, partial [Akkermansiaceae bacterium]|nr:hypothetical protein [Akkermansiaceae bacterium]
CKRDLWGHKTLEDIPQTCRVLRHTDHLIEMPFITQGWNWEDRGWNLYPLDKARSVLAYMQALHDKRVCMVDWAPGAFLFDEEGALHVTDFEYAHPFPNPSLSFRENADMTGSGHEVTIPGCEAVSYQRVWQPITGLDLETLLKGSESSCNRQRFFYLLKKRWPRFAGKTLENCFKPIKVFIKTRRFIRDDGNSIVFKK